MDRKKEPISSSTLILRYFILTLMTLSSLAMVGASFWTVHLFVHYADVFPGVTGEKLNLGVYQDISQIRQKGGVLISRVEPNSTADKAGIKPGDLIVAIDGASLKEKPQIFYASFIRKPPGAQIQIDLIRAGQSKHLTLILEENRSTRLSWTYLGLPIKGSVGREITTLYLPWLILQLLFLVVGALIGWLRPKNPLAFQCSILLLCAGEATFLFDTPFLASWPFWALAAVLISQNISSGLVLPLTLRLLSIFPNPTSLGRFLRRWQWVAFLLFILYLFAETADDLSGLFGSKSAWLVVNPLSHFFASIDQWLVVVFFALSGLLLVAQRIETRTRPQIRLRVIELGFLLGILGVFIFLVARPIILRLLSESWYPVHGILLLFLSVILFIATPLSFAYAIVARRVFGIRLILRRGLQYLLLSRAALLLEVIIVFFIIRQVILKGGISIFNSLTVVSLLVVASAFLVIAALSQVKRKIMPAIDRRFFRETYDVRRLLLELSEQLSVLRVREKILSRSAAVVLKALHPSRVVLLLREKQTRALRSVLVLENGRSRLDPVEQLEVEARSASSFELKPEDSMVQLLEKGEPWVNVYPEELNPYLEEESRLIELKAELLIGLPGSSGLLGVMGLGPKLSEEPFSSGDKELLLAVVREMGLALENAELLEVAKREAELSRDLEIARQVQQNLFPKELPISPGWDFAGICRPARAVGGDYYDIFEVAPGKVILALGDVSGKGLGASLLMADVHAEIRSLASLLLDKLSELIQELNHRLLSETAPEDYLTLFVGILDLNTGELKYINGGHPPPVLIRQEGKTLEKLTDGGPIIGILDGSVYQQGICRMAKGDILVVYSDGVTEAMNDQEEMYEEKNLVQLLNDASGSKASDLMQLILKSVDDFRGDAEQGDDISLVVVQRNSEI